METPIASAAGKPADSVARDAGLECIGRLSPRTSDDIAKSRWGVCCHWIADKHKLSVKEQVEQLAWLGAKWAFLCPDWDQIETQKGRYDWNSDSHRFDDVIAELTAHKIAPVIQIYGGNRLYMSFAPDSNHRPLADAASLLDDAPVRDAWHRFLTAMVERYRDRVHVWEIWNEPNSVTFWKTPVTPDQYGRIVNDAAAIVRRGQPNAVILAGSTAGTPADFLEGLLASDGAAAFDHWSVHPYGQPPEQEDGPIQRLQDLLRQRNHSPDVWQSECGFPSSGDTGGWGFGGSWDETKHAKWLLRRLLSDAKLGMPVSIYFVLNDYPARLEGGPDRGSMGVNRKGLFASESWQPKAAAFAFRNLASAFDDRCKPTPIPMQINIVDKGSFETTSPDKLRSLTAVDPSGRPLIYYWLAVEMQAVCRPGAAELELPADKLPKNPVLVDLLDGRVYRVPPPRSTGDQATFSRLPLTDAPFLFCDRESLPIATETGEKYETGPILTK